MRRRRAARDMSLLSRLCSGARHAQFAKCRNVKVAHTSKSRPCVAVFGAFGFVPSCMWAKVSDCRLGSCCCRCHHRFLKN